MTFNRRQVLAFFGASWVLGGGGIALTNYGSLGQNYSSDQSARVREILFGDMAWEKAIESLGISEQTTNNIMRDFVHYDGDLGDHIKRDFKNKNICLIKGWVLSQTEVVLCLMT